MDAAQTGQAGAGDDPHDHCLGLIIFLMRRGDEVEFQRGANLLQSPLPDFARRGFHSRAADLVLIERSVANFQCDAESRAEIADKGLVGVRFVAAKVMVHVRADDR